MHGSLKTAKSGLHWEAPLQSITQVSTHPYSSTWQHRTYVWCTQSFQRKSSIRQTHTLTDMKTNSLTGLQIGTYVKHHLQVTPYAQHIFKYWRDNWAVGALRHFKLVAKPLLSQVLSPLWTWSPSGCEGVFASIWCSPHHVGSCSPCLGRWDRERACITKVSARKHRGDNSYHSGKNQASSFLKTNTTKSILATHHVLLLKANYWCKPALEISDTSWPTMQHPSPGTSCKQLFCHKEVTITLLTA